MLDAHNTYVRPNGTRNCRLCRHTHRETYEKAHPSDNSPTCVCGATYAEFRLGMSFADVRQMLWDQEDPNRPGWFRQKRRNSILGYCRELKLHAWDLLHGYCAQEEEAA